MNRTGERLFVTKEVLDEAIAAHRASMEGLSRNGFGPDFGSLGVVLGEAYLRWRTDQINKGADPRDDVLKPTAAMAAWLLCQAMRSVDDPGNSFLLFDYHAQAFEWMMGLRATQVRVDPVKGSA